MTDVTVNYTAEDTARLVNAYTNAQSDAERVAVVEEFADELGKSKGSVRAKLVSEGVYVAVTRTRKRVQKKAEILTALAQVLGVDEDVIGSLEKATATALLAVHGAVGRIKREAE